MLWLALYFPLLPLQIFTRGELSPNRPTLISEQHRVLCVNPAAQAAGIKPEQSVTTAHALQPGLRSINRDIVRENQALARLAHWAYQFTPMVSPKPPSLLLLEIQGSLRLFGGLDRLRRQIDNGLDLLGFSARQGLADTPKAAELLARRPTVDTPTDNGPADYHQALQQIPLQLLTLPAKQHQVLQEMGLTRLGELLALPPHAIGRRFGKALLTYLQQLTGERPDPQPPFTPAANFHSELVYVEGIGDKQGLLFPIKRLLQECCVFLSSRQLRCHQLHWTFAELRQPPRQLTIRLAQPQQSLSLFLELTRIRLERFALPSAVHVLTLHAGKFSVAHPVSRSLLPLAPSERDDSDNNSPGLLPDKLMARLGPQAVYGLAADDAHPPEQAWQAQPVCRDLQDTANISPQAVSVLRPFWLLPKPVPIRQRQRQLFWQGRLTLLRGPERIDNGWWHCARVQRDYFIARHDSGSLYWVFRTPHDRRWFVHGVFY